MPAYDALLLDARNSIYRAVYAGHGDERFNRTGHHFLVVFFRFLNSYRTDFMPRNMHIFWDAPKKEIWRKAIMESYKEGREPNREGFKADDAVNDCCEKSYKIMDAMGFYQYAREGTEADDLIYAWCRANRDKKTIIISSDGDLVQIPYLFDNVDIYNPLKGEMVEMPELDPVEMKSFEGDSSDAIPGYPKIGPKRAAELVRDLSWRKKFFEKNGRAIYDRNRQLVDLTLCPGTIENICHIADVMAEEKSFDSDAVKKLIFRIRGLMPEYASRILPFKSY